MSIKENDSSTKASATDTSSVSSASFEPEKAVPSHYDDDDDDEQSIHVKFQNIEIRNYGMTLGDNPSCSYGPPVSLDWDYGKTNVVPVDDYEESRGTRRQSYQMQMNSRYRKKILNNMHFTPDEIDRSVKEVNSIKKNRERTKMMLPLWKLEDAAESAKRKAKRAMA